MTTPVVAVDGPVAAGKGTLARRLADHYGFAYLDTGALYRRVGLLVLDAGGDPGTLDHALAAVPLLESQIIEDAALRTDRVGEAASKVAALTPVREALLSYQRAFAKAPGTLSDGRSARGAVLDGRDIGTVVCPGAPVKLFVTASPQVRARRRFSEFRDKGLTDITYEQVLQDLQARDERDRTRAAAPLVPAEDAHLLDTTELDRHMAFEAAREIIDASMSIDRGAPGSGL
ncbi:MAG: (d)CMP kinase [Alphaproteobacteria bacterium]